MPFLCRYPNLWPIHTILRARLRHREPLNRQTSKRHAGRGENCEEGRSVRAPVHLVWISVYLCVIREPVPSRLTQVDLCHRKYPRKYTATSFVPRCMMNGRATDHRSSQQIIYRRSNRPQVAHRFRVRLQGPCVLTAMQLSAHSSNHSLPASRTWPACS